MSDAPRRVQLNVLVAAVTAAERGAPMPITAALAERLGCAPHAIAMAVASLERAGILKRLSKPGTRRRVLVVQTGAATAACAVDRS
jgi:DNA-binding MarR family transcriptional regulator